MLRARGYYTEAVACEARESPHDKKQQRWIIKIEEALYKFRIRLADSCSRPFKEFGAGGGVIFRDCHQVRRNRPVEMETTRSYHLEKTGRTRRDNGKEKRNVR